MASPTTRPVRTRADVIRVVLVSIGFAVGFMGLVWGVTGAVTGREALGLPDEIEQVSPAPNDNQVLSQTEIFVDLVENTEAELIVDGVRLDVARLGEVTAQPGEQVELPPTAIYDPGNFSIRFQPQAGAAIERWSLGTHTVTVEFWDIEEGRGAATTFTWSFSVL